jgi:tetratricopeptide (TPR) repeat protein
MAQLSESITLANENAYENLISLIENNQNQLSLIIVSCDDLTLRQQMIDRYEQEAKLDNIQSQRIVLGTEPSLRAGLAKLELPAAARVVVTVTGSEWLLRVKTRSSDAQSDLQKFFGYLQWTREGLREFQYPVVLWITSTILLAMSRKAPDFWSWRKAVLRFASEADNPVLPVEQEDSSAPAAEAFASTRVDRDDDDFIPPPAEILSEISQLANRDPKSPNLATLYAKLAEIYTKRIARGEAADLEQEQQQAIDAYHQAIDLCRKLNKQSTLASLLNNLGNFLFRQSRYQEAIKIHQQSLAIWHEINDVDGKANSLNALGIAYSSLGQYQQAIEVHQQSLDINLQHEDIYGEAASLTNLGIAYKLSGEYEKATELYQRSLDISRRIGDRNGEANSLNNLGLIYESLKQYQRAIEFHQQSLEISDEIGYLGGKANSLNNIGIIYQSLKQYQEAINFYQLSLDIKRKIGDRDGEAISLGSLGNTYHFLDQHQRAIELYEQALEIKREVGDHVGEANIIFNQALVRAEDKCSHIESINLFKQAHAIYTELKLDKMAEKCNEQIRELG